MTAAGARVQDSAPSSRMKLLIVDDEELNVRLLVTALKDSYTLFTATNGEDALRLMREQQPDLVLLDIQLPGMDGLEVCRRAQADAALANVPIIFVTALATRAGQTTALELGAVDFLIKPVNIVHLRLRVRNQLALKQQRDEGAATICLLETSLAEISAAQVRRTVCPQCLAQQILINQETRA